MENAARRIYPIQPNVPRVLREFYHEEALMTVGAESLGMGQVEVTFRFPDYTRALSDMGHVSSIQMTAAIIEGGYCAIEDALSSKMFHENVTPEWFYSTLADWLALRINVLFRRPLKVGEDAKLKFRIIDIGIQRFRRRRLSVTIEFDGFCSGETVWVIDPPLGMIC